MKNRVIKFRAWDTTYGEYVQDIHPIYISFPEIKSDRHCFEQFTGLLDRNGVAEVYEGDILDVDGIIKGNIHESPQIYEKGVDCLVEGMGTSSWRDTESVAVGRGCRYAE